MTCSVSVWLTCLIEKLKIHKVSENMLKLGERGTSVEGENCWLKMSAKMICSEGGMQIDNHFIVNSDIRIWFIWLTDNVYFSMVDIQKRKQLLILNCSQLMFVQQVSLLVKVSQKLNALFSLFTVIGKNMQNAHYGSLFWNVNTEQAP